MCDEKVRTSIPLTFPSLNISDIANLLHSPYSLFRIISHLTVIL